MPPNPSFPYFRKLDVIDEEKIMHLFDGQMIPSDYQFSSLLAWDVDNTLSISWLSDNLVVNAKNHMNGIDRILFAGKHDVSSSIKKIFSWQTDQGKKRVLNLVPEFVTHNLDKDYRGQLSISEDRDNADYILCTGKLCSLQGNDIARTRERISQALRFSDSEILYEDIDLCSSTGVDEIMRVYEQWANARGQNSPSAERDRIALMRLIKLRCQACRAFGIRYRGKLHSFIIWEQITSDTCVVHFEKSVRYLKGLTPLTLHRLACALKLLLLRWINYEQDLGIPGLRNSKEQLCPVTMLKKYTITDAKT